MAKGKVSGKGGHGGNDDHEAGQGEHVPHLAHDLVVRISQPFTIRQQATTEDNEQYAEERESRSSQLRTAERLNLITIASGLIAVIALIFVYLQYRQSRDVFEAGQRAWVLVVSTPILNAGVMAKTVEGHIISNPITAGTEQIAEITFKNTGMSPALKVHMNVEQPLFQGQDCPEHLQQSPYDSVSTIAPGESNSNINTDFLSTTACVEALRSGKATMQLKGTVWYEDIFHHSHESHFCRQYEGMATQQMSNCKEGNEAN